MDKTHNLQDVFLNQVRKQHVPVTIFLVNGVKLQGVITWFDNYSMLLKRDGHIQLIYKHAVSTIMPSTPLNMQDIEGEEHLIQALWCLMKRFYPSCVRRRNV